MADEIIAPVDAKEPNRMEMMVETNSAPDTKQPEMVTTEPKTPELQTKEEPAKEPEKAPVEPEPIKPSPEETKNIEARERLAEKIRTTAQQQKPSYQAPVGDAPKIENFSTLEDFLTKRDEWARNKAITEFTATQNQEAAQRAQRERQAAVAAKAAVTRQKYPDFNSTIQPYAEFMDAIPALNAYVNESDMGTEIAYQLAKNPALLEEISRMSAFAAGRQLLKLEEKLKAPPKTVSNAPEPIKPVGSRETVKPRLAELAAKDINGYMQTMNKRELAAKRAN